MGIFSDKNPISISIDKYKGQLVRIKTGKGEIIGRLGQDYKDSGGVKKISIDNPLIKLLYNAGSALPGWRLENDDLILSILPEPSPSPPLAGGNNKKKTFSQLLEENRRLSAAGSF